MARKLPTKLLQSAVDVVGIENPPHGLPSSYGWCLRCGEQIKLLNGQQFFQCSSDTCKAQQLTRALVFRKEARFKIEVSARRVYHYSAGGAVFCQFAGERFRRVLLMRGTTYPVGAYSAPAGHWDLGESAQAAAKREISEETGIKLNALRLDAEVTGQDAELIEEGCRRGSDHHLWRFFVFSCDPNASEAKLRPHADATSLIGEADIIGWVPIPEVLKGRFPLIKPVGHFLSKYLKRQIPNVLPR